MHYAILRQPVYSVLSEFATAASSLSISLSSVYIYNQNDTLCIHYKLLFVVGYKFC